MTALSSEVASPQHGRTFLSKVADLRAWLFLILLLIFFEAWAQTVYGVTFVGNTYNLQSVGIFATAPGWRIVAPSTAADYVGLMNAALALEDPVLMIEHLDLYQRMDRVPEGDLDYIIPPGRAALLREGSDATVISYLSMVHHCAEALDQTGLDADLIDLRWLDRASIDWETIEASIKKTNAAVIVE